MQTEAGVSQNLLKRNQNTHTYTHTHTQKEKKKKTFILKKKPTTNKTNKNQQQECMQFKASKKTGHFTKRRNAQLSVLF